jgi:hypothetical protein
MFAGHDMSCPYKGRRLRRLRLKSKNIRRLVKRGDDQNGAYRNDAGMSQTQLQGAEAVDCARSRRLEARSP